MATRHTSGSRVSAMRALCIAVLVCTLLVASLQPVSAQSTDEVNTIRMVANALNRLGEKNTAKRLLEDFYQAKPPRVRIQDLGEAGVTAETGPDSMIGRGQNYMTLDASIIQQVGGMKALAEKSGRTHHPATSQ